MDTYSKTDRFVMKTYNRYPVSFVKGEGCWLYDEEGKKYLDMLAGIAVCNLGHCHPRVSEAICQQAKTLIHTSNLFHIEPQAELARLICENSFGEKVFFCNSGAEANEGAIKLARRRGTAISPDKYEIIAFKGSFHGRTVAAVSVTGQGKYYQGFGPMLQGVKFARFNDLSSVEELIGDNTAAVIVEPVQGEGGVVPAEEEFLRGLRELTRRHDALLIFDEVQTGLGRTGKLFAYQHYGVEPDVMTLAKALGNGVPIGAVVAKGEAATVLEPGTHASTFGGNFLSTRAGVEVMKELTKEGFMEEVNRKARYLRERLEELAGRYPSRFEGVRGLGMMLGLVCKEPCSRLAARCLEKGLIINCTANRVLRFLPPLVINEEEIDYGLSILEEVLREDENSA
jgi:predicted acetylornithine/succinylornithine family transaminase